MKRYIGLYNAHDYRVQVDERPLPLHRHYVNHRKWHTEPGRKQLALDLLIDVLGETIPRGFLMRRDLSGTEAGYQHSCAAWLPHLHYAAELHTLARDTGYGHWELTSEQIVAWLDDWLFMHHQKKAKTQLGGAYQGMPFAAWSTMFQATITTFGVADLQRVKLGRPAQIQYYLAGYTPEGMVVAWCQRVIRITEKTSPVTEQIDAPF